MAVNKKKKLFGQGDGIEHRLHLVHEEKCSAAGEREGAAGCAAPLGVFLSLAELLRVQRLSRRFREDIQEGKYHQPVSPLQRRGSDERR